MFIIGFGGLLVRFRGCPALHEPLLAAFATMCSTAVTVGARFFTRRAITHRRKKMDAKMTIKVLSNYEKGWITASEVASKLLYELVLQPEADTGLVSAVASLPDEVKQEFYRLLGSIKEANYQWTPFLLGVRTEPSDSGKYSEKIRRISTLLEQIGPK